MGIMNYETLSLLFSLETLLGHVARNFTRRLTSRGSTITYLPSPHFIETRKYRCMCSIHLFVLPLCALSPCSHTSHLISGARFIGMTKLLVPLPLLLVICFDPSTPVLGVIKVPLNCVMQMCVEERTQKCRACLKPIALARINRRKNLLDPVLKHVSISVCENCYLAGCTEYIARHCRNFHKQKSLHVPAAYPGRFFFFSS